MGLVLGSKFFASASDGAAAVRTSAISSAARGKLAQILGDLVGGALVAFRSAIDLAAAVLGGGIVDTSGRDALAGLGGGDKSDESDDGGEELHFELS